MLMLPMLPHLIAQMHLVISVLTLMSMTLPCCLTCRTALDGFLCSYLDVNASNVASPAELHLMAFFVLTLMLMQAMLPHPQNYTWWLSLFLPWCWCKQCCLTHRITLDSSLCSYLDVDASNAVSPTELHLMALFVLTLMLMQAMLSHPQNYTRWLSLFLPWCWSKQCCLTHRITLDGSLCSYLDVDASNAASSTELYLVAVLTLMLMQAMLPHPQNYTCWLSLFLPWCWCKQCCLTHRITLDGSLCSYLDVDASNAASSTELHLMALFVLTLMLMQAMLPHPQNCTWWLFLAWCWCKQCYLAHRTAPDGFLCSYLDGDAGNVASPVKLHLMTLFVHTLMSMPAILPRP